MTAKRQTIYFQHIPKTAGTAVRMWLASHFGESFCPAGIADQLVTIPPAALERYSAFAGHFHGYLAAYIGREVVGLATLRDPIARTRSHWHEVRRTTHHPHHARVRGQSFEEFVQDELNRVMIENYQARYLAYFPIDMRALARRFADDELSRYGLAEALEQASLSVAQPSLAASANESVGRMAVVGVSERLHDFLVKVGRLLDIPAPSPATVPRANVTNGDVAYTLSAAALGKLREMTRIDQDLYERVRSQA